ncbi:MAG: hypothetical protein GX488_08665 [Clostridiales bacterium]|nr:hypothetical protein [Clostridiales bacterium]
MIDFHAHFLPEMDDGSKSAEEAVKMLRLSYDNGVDTIVSASHYYAERESTEDFLKRRKDKFFNLTHEAEKTDKIPKIILGAEVDYFPGIDRYREIHRLCLDGTKCILIEMPYSEWSSIEVREIINLVLLRGITPIMAHIERYLKHKRNVEALERLFSLGAVAQINADCLYGYSESRKALKLIKENKPVVLGSDCHNMSDRQPGLDRAVKIIEKTLGLSYVEKIERLGRELIENKGVF